MPPMPEPVPNPANPRPVAVPVAARPPAPSITFKLPRPPAIINTPPTTAAMLKALKRRWQLAVLVAPILAGVVMAVVWNLMPPPRHTARSRIMIKPRPDLPIGSPETTFELEVFRMTQQDLLRSRLVLNSALRSEKVQALAAAQGMDLLPYLEYELRATFAQSPEILNITLQGQDAESIRVIVDAVVTAYMSEIVNRERTIRQATIENFQAWLDRYEEDKKRKRDLHKRLQDAAKGSADVRAVEVRRQLVERNIQEISNQLQKLRTELRIYETELNALTRNDPSKINLNDPAFQEFFKNDRTIQQLSDDKTRIELALADAKRTFIDPNNRTIKRREQELADVNDEITRRKQELRTSAEQYWRDRAKTDADSRIASTRDFIARNKELEKQFDNDLKEQEKLLLTLGQGALDLAQFERENNPLESMATKMAERIEQLKLENSYPPRVLRLEEATVLLGDSRSRHTKITVLAGIGSIVIVLAGLSWFEFRTRRVESVDQIVHGLGLPLVGTVPAMPTAGVLKFKGPDELEMEKWRVALQESVATARTMLLNSARTSGVRVVMVTSAIAGEGKTSLSTQLAVSLASAGYRTILIDFDLRSPAAHKLLGIEQAPGWCEILRGETTLQEAVRQTALPNLAFVPAGNVDPVALHALVQEGLKESIDSLRHSYDFVVVDTCPVLPVVDALLIGRYVDGVIFSIMYEYSQLPKIYTAAQRVKTVGIRTLGAVVNGTRSDGFGYGYGHRGPAPAKG